jgi:hypothetical protein
MSKEEFWQLIAAARSQPPGPDDGQAVARQATALLAARPAADGEEMLYIAWNAHVTATGEHLPGGAFTIRRPELDPAWNFDFGDRDEMARRLPRLAALYRE